MQNWLLFVSAYFLPSLGFGAGGGGLDTLFEDGLSTPEVDIIGRDVPQRFMIAMGVVKSDEPFDLIAKLIRRLMDQEVHSLLA